MSAQNQVGEFGPGAQGFDTLSTDLKTLAVFCSAVPEIHEDLRRVAARVDSHEDSIAELEDTSEEMRAEVDEIREALRQLTSNTLDLEETVKEERATREERLDDIEARLDAIEGVLDSDTLEDERAHTEAQDGSIPFDKGDKRKLFIEEIENTHDPTLRGKLEKVQTFVDVDSVEEYEKGEVIEVVITDLNDTAAHAAPAAKYEE